MKRLILIVIVCTLCTTSKAQPAPETRAVTHLQARAAMLYGVPLVRQASTSVVTVSHTEGGTSIAWMAAGGVVGGAVGVGAGAYAGHYFDLDLDSWIPAYAILGGFIGMTLGIPVGVHLINGRRGRLLNEVIGSIAIGALGLITSVLLFSNGSTAGLVIAAATPIAQLGMSIYLERSTARAGTEY